MGCGRSKKLQITSPEDQPGSPPHDNDVKRKRLAIPSKKPHIEHQNVQIDVFQDTTNNNELGGSNYNAKPRLRSAIRRGNDTSIRPVITEEKQQQQQQHQQQQQPEESVTQPYVGPSIHTPVCDVPPKPDSGFGTYRANSEVSDWVQSHQEDLGLRSGRLSHSSCVSIRAESAMTSSVVTARDLNTSFLTVCDDFNGPVNGDLTFGTDTPLEELSDYLDDTPFRTLSNTPSRSMKSVEPIPISMHPKNIGVIREESENGFTPRSIVNQDEGYALHVKEEQTRHDTGDLPKHFADEVLSHNHDVGWCERGIYKGRIYDTTKVIHALGPMYNEKNRNETDKRNAERLKNKDDDSFSLSDSDSESDSEESFKTFAEMYPKEVMNPISSLERGIKLLVKSDIDMNVIIQKLAECIIGEVKNNFSRQFWEKFRNDVEHVLDDLIRVDLQDDLSVNVRDVMKQLQRWIEMYRHQDPVTSPRQPGDPNVQDFVLPVGVGDHPELLRQWVETWTPLDLSIPEGGAWFMYEIEDIDLGDPNEIFQASLRTHVDLETPFTSPVDGEAAWDVLAPGLFADDVMTEQQKLTEEKRHNRTDLDDPKRMARRRKHLLRYFIQKYEMDRSNVDHFLIWAQSMEDGHKRFQKLCEK